MSYTLRQLGKCIKVSHVYLRNQNLYELHRKMACLVICGKRGAVGVHPLGRVGSLMSVVYGIMTLISDLESSGLLLNCEEGRAGFCLPNRRPRGHGGVHFMILENKQDILTTRYVYMYRSVLHFISVCILFLFMNLCFVISSYLSRERSQVMHVDRQTFTCYSCVGMSAVILFLYQISSIT